MRDKWRFATESEPDEDSLQREEPELDDEAEDNGDERDGVIALAIRVTKLNIEDAQVLLHGLQASQAGDQPEVKRAIAQHDRLQARIRTLSARLPAEHEDDNHVEA